MQSIIALETLLLWCCKTLRYHKEKEIMKIQVLSLMGLLLHSAQVFAEGNASWTCKGQSYEIQSITKYYGENDPRNDTTYYNISKKGVNDLSLKFVKDSPEADDIGKYGEQYFSFYSRSYRKLPQAMLILSHPTDVSDGTTIHLKASGKLKVFTGRLKGVEEQLNCEMY
jgi:hypothetical protein